MLKHRILSFKKLLSNSKKILVLFCVLNSVLILILQSCTTSSIPETPFFLFPKEDQSKTYRILDSIQNEDSPSTTNSKPLKISYSKENNSYVSKIGDRINSGFFSSSLTVLEFQDLNLTPLFLLKNNQIKGPLPSFEFLLPESLDITFEHHFLEKTQILYRNKMETVIPIQFNFYSENRLILQYLFYNHEIGIIQVIQKWNSFYLSNNDSSFLETTIQRTYTLQ